jgi:hypothetical protein
MDLCRVDFALIPGDPLFHRVIDASQAITDEYYYNQNVIDDKKFPPHVSLLISPIPRDTVPQVGERLSALAGRLPDLTPSGVELVDSGYIMLAIERSDALVSLHEAVLEIAAEARAGLGSSDKYGSQYIRDLFDPHISLAKLEYKDQDSAADLGEEALGELASAPSRSLDLCDIGERSERWELLASVS